MNVLAVPEKTVPGWLGNAGFNNNNLEIKDCIAFDEMCCRSSGCSEKSIELTSLALRKLEQFLCDAAYPTVVSDIRRPHIRAFILHLQGQPCYQHHPFATVQPKPLSDQSVSVYLRSIRAACNRWVNEGILPCSPFDGLKIPKVKKKIIPTFTPQHLEALFGVIDTTTAEGFRDYTLIATYLDTACRLSEITELSPEDVDINRRCLKVMGKGGRERLVPFSPRLQKLLWKYWNGSRPEPENPNRDRFFLTGDGRPLTKNRVEAILKKYGRKAGITGVRVSPHTLRHTACVLWFRNGGDLYSLQDVTGHSSLSVLRGYVNLNGDDLAAAHRRYSPLEAIDLPQPRRKKSFK
jgi:integrase/recombinase XerD